jgi:hypothetical protein
MVAIRLSAMVGKDRRLVIDLPEEVPVGEVQLLITAADTTSISEREALRAHLQAAGLLVKPQNMGIPDDLEYVSDDELEALEPLPPGTPSALDLINEDRGPY